MSRITADIAKIDDEAKQVFGWASITDKAGEPIIDKQGDQVAIGELEKAAYDYVLHSRVGGAMHGRVGKKDAPKQVGTLIESFLVTPEKVEKMGLEKDSLPNGWWIGFQVQDDGVWNRVKKGEFTQFSIHGKGKRVPMSKRDLTSRGQACLHTLDELHKRTSTQEEFIKAVAGMADELTARGYPEATFFGELTKHLIGDHDQASHGRDDHNTKEAAKTGLKYGSAAGATLGTIAGAKYLGLRGIPAQAIRSGLFGGTVGLGAGAGVGSYQTTSKHLIGQHEQKDHAPDGHTRGAHEVTGGDVALGAGVGAIPGTIFAGPIGGVVGGAIGSGVGALKSIRDTGKEAEAKASRDAASSGKGAGWMDQLSEESGLDHKEILEMGGKEAAKGNEITDLQDTRRMLKEKGHL